MNKELREVRLNLRKIKKYCESRPVPSFSDLKMFLFSEGLEEFEKFSGNYLASVHEAEWLQQKRRINKYR